MFSGNALAPWHTAKAWAVWDNTPAKAGHKGRPEGEVVWKPIWENTKTQEVHARYIKRKGTDMSQVCQLYLTKKWTSDPVLEFACQEFTNWIQLNEGLFSDEPVLVLLTEDQRISNLPTNDLVCIPERPVPVELNQWNLTESIVETVNSSIECARIFFNRSISWTCNTWLQSCYLPEVHYVRLSNIKY